tara:strand:+ start:43 stop:702 length:660 start_codon:yes stop_codon:yes gene_type:complete
MQASPWTGHTGYQVQQPSNWWSWGLAIFIGISVFFSMIGLLLSALIPYDQLVVELKQDEPGPYPEAGTSEEQESWNESKAEYDEYIITKELFDNLESMKNTQIILGLITSTFGIVSLFLLVQLHPKRFYFAFAWIGCSAISSIVGQVMSYSMMGDLYQSIPEMDTGPWMSIQMGFGIGATIVCNLSLFCIILTCAIKSKGDQLEESGFHFVPSQQNQEN